MGYFQRTVRLIFGLFLYALGSYLSIQANIGLAPWDAFSMGVSKVSGVSFGNVVIFTGIAIIVLDVFLKEKIGVGTILNAIMIGQFIDLLRYIDILPLMSNMWIGIPMLLLGQVSISLGSYFYIGAKMGCGPRDTLMVALGKRMPKAPIGVVRGLIEGTVLIIGWLLGAKIGIGTVIAVFGISFILQYTFKLLKFDVKGIEHENIVETAHLIFDADKQE